MAPVKEKVFIIPPLPTDFQPSQDYKLVPTGEVLVRCDTCGKVLKKMPATSLEVIKEVKANALEHDRNIHGHRGSITVNYQLTPVLIGRH